MSKNDFNKKDWEKLISLREELARVTEEIEEKMEPLYEKINVTNGEYDIIDYFLKNKNEAVTKMKFEIVEMRKPYVGKDYSDAKRRVNRKINSLRKRGYVEMPEHGLYRLVPEVYETLCIKEMENAF